ncbi:MAG: response regulator [Polyangiaceae bacterium]
MTPSTPNPPSRKILVVDDDSRAGYALGKMLMEDGFEVSVCTSVSEALDILEQDVFDTVVTDLELMGQSGLELVRRAREKSREIRLFVLTAAQRWQHESKLAALGVSEQFTKPVDYAALVECLGGNPAI